MLCYPGAGELEEKLKRTSAWDIPPQPVHQVDRAAASVALRLLPAYSNADPDYDAVQRTVFVIPDTLYPTKYSGQFSRKVN